VARESQVGVSWRKITLVLWVRVTDAIGSNRKEDYSGLRKSCRVLQWEYGMTSVNE